jgi:hypothetical protein
MAEQRSTMLTATRSDQIAAKNTSDIREKSPPIIHHRQQTLIGKDNFFGIAVH